MRVSRTCEPRGDLVPAERAQPGEQGSLASVGVQLPDGPDQRRLHDLLRAVVVSRKPRTGKPVEPRKIVRKKLLERGFVAGQQPAGEREVVHRGDKVLKFQSSREFKSSKF